MEKGVITVAAIMSINFRCSDGEQTPITTPTSPASTSPPDRNNYNDNASRTSWNNSYNNMCLWMSMP